MEQILFYAFGIIAVLGALCVVLFSSPVSSAISLVVTLFALACLYALMGAHFVAAMQILLYAGAIMVLFLFVIMLLHRGEQVHPRKLGLTFAGVVGLIAAAYLALIMMVRLLALRAPEAAAIDANFGTLKPIGRLLFSTYLVPFEVTSFLLLVAVVGVVLLSKGLHPGGRG